MFDMFNIFTEVLDFITDVFTALNNFIIWIGQLAEKLDDISFADDSAVTLVLGMYRYIVGDTVYLANVSTLWIAIVFMTIKLIGMLVEYWKKYNPMS